MPTKNILPTNKLFLKFLKANDLLNKFNQHVKSFQKKQISKVELSDKIRELIWELELPEVLRKKIIRGELDKDKKTSRKLTISEAIIRPTGLIDPEIILKPVTNQVDDVLEQVREKVQKGQRVLITTLTKKFAEELDIYFKQINIKSAYIHSDVETLDRIQILSDLRHGKYDVLIGINLLREGLDLPEVSLVAIFDADKEGFLRSRTSLIQIIGRAARHSEGKVIMYGSNITFSMQQAISETERRRQIQIEYNLKHNIIPKSTQRELQTLIEDLDKEIEADSEYGLSGANYTPSGWEKNDKKGSKSIQDDWFSDKNSKTQKKRGKQVYEDFEVQKNSYINDLSIKKLTKKQLQNKLEEAVSQMNFEEAAAIRDIIKQR